MRGCQLLTVANSSTFSFWDKNMSCDFYCVLPSCVEQIMSASIYHAISIKRQSAQFAIKHIFSNEAKSIQEYHTEISQISPYDTLPLVRLDSIRFKIRGLELSFNTLTPISTTTATLTTKNTHTTTRARNIWGVHPCYQVL